MNFETINILVSSMDRSIVDASRALLLAGKSILLAGAPGTGKTRLAISLSEAFTGIEPVIVVGRGDMTSQDLIYSYQPGSKGLRLNLGELAISVTSSWIRLLAGLTPRWILFDEINRMNAETVLGKLFTALDLPYREKVEIVPLNVLRDILEDEKLLDIVSSYAGLDRETAKTNLMTLIERIKELGLAGLPLPYSWRSIATINIVDRAHLFRLGFALLRRYPIIMVPGIGVNVKPSINQETLQNIINEYKRLYNVIERIITPSGEPGKGELCRSSLRELALRSRITGFDRPIYIIDVGMLEEAYTRYELPIKLAVAVSAALTKLGVEIGYALLSDICKVSATASLLELDESLLADILVSSILLPQLGSLAPTLKMELLLQGSSWRAERVAEFLSLIVELLGENSLSAIHAEALRLELPYTQMWVYHSVKRGH